MMTKTKIALAENWEMKIFWPLVFVILSLVFVYLYFINISILSVVERQKIEERISLKETELTLLVADYFSALAGINNEIAESMGFEPVNGQIIFATRGPLEQQITLSHLDNEN